MLIYAIRITPFIFPPKLITPLPEFKQVAQAAVHFEQTLDTLFYTDKEHPPRRNWLRNQRFGAKSRDEAIDAIEATESEKEFKMLFQYRWKDISHFRWEFKTFETPAMNDPHCHVEWRNPAAIIEAEDAIQWATFVVSFVRASLECYSPAELKDIDANHDGLRQFCTGKPVSPGSNTITRGERKRRALAYRSLHHTIPLNPIMAAILGLPSGASWSSHHHDPPKPDDDNGGRPRCDGVALTSSPRRIEWPSRRGLRQ
jgi:hypothetical protein